MTLVRDLMVKSVYCCLPTDSLSRAARIMWERDCGSVVVVDGEGRLVGVITDRDVCMGAFTHSRSLNEIPVSASCARRIFTCAPDDTIDHAVDLMMQHQVRRLPVVGRDGLLLGLLSVSDLAQEFARATPHKASAVRVERLASLVAAVSRPRRAPDDPNHRAHPVSDVPAS